MKEDKIIEEITAKASQKAFQNDFKYCTPGLTDKIVAELTSAANSDGKAAFSHPLNKS